MPLPKDLVKSRLAVNEDLNFILSSWLRSYRNTYLVRFVNNDTYFSAQKRLIMRILEQRTVMVISSNEDSDQIIGYLVYGPYSLNPTSVVLDYAYVKSPYRKMGFLRHMVDSVSLDYAKDTKYLCPIITQLSLKLQPKFGYTFNPYIYSK